MNKPTVYVLTKRADRPSLKGRYYPGYFRMPSSEEILDEATEKIRTIRYALGEPSIYKDEQPEKVTVGDIIFTNGTLTLDRTNPNLIQFLALSNHNEANPNRMPNKRVFFRLLDPEKSAKISVDSVINESKAVNVALTMEFSKLVGYAKVMGMDVERSADEIRHDMIMFAKKNPKLFMDGVDDPVIARQTVLAKAKELGIITMDGRTVKWNTGGKGTAIITCPVGMNLAKYFAEWTMNEKDGGDVFDEIEKKVSKATVV